MSDNITKTFNKFIDLINGRVTETTTNEYINTHPDYPSMAVFIDALENWNIENFALRVKKEDYHTVPVPNITYLSRFGGTFAVVKQVTKESITWYDTNGKWITQANNLFFKDWSGVVIVAEANNQSGEPSFTQNNRIEFLNKLKLPVSIILSLLFLVFVLNFTTSNLNSNLVLLLIFKLLGLGITTLLLLKSIFLNSTIANKVCSFGTKVSCQSILESNAAHLTSWLSLSDVGFIYFMSTFIGLMISFISVRNENFINNFIDLQFILSTGSISFSIFSIYYQGFIAKIWCPLCLSTVLVLWLEFIYLLYFEQFYINLTSVYIALPLFFTGIIPPTIILMFFKKLYLGYQNGNIYKNELHRLKNNPILFQSILTSQKSMPFLPQGIGVITIGNEKAQHILSVVSNPLCTPCAKMHERIENLIANNSSIKCQIIFKTNPDDIDIGGKVVRKILSLSNTKQHDAISSWYKRNDQNYDSWNKAYNDVPERDVAKVWEDDMRFWCYNSEIRRTPTLFFNGYQLPDFINVEDLSFPIRFINN